MRLGHSKLIIVALSILVLGGMVWVPVALAADVPAWVSGEIRGQGYQYNTTLSGATVDLYQVKAGLAPIPTGFMATTAPNGLYTINVLTQDDSALLPLYYGGNCIIVPSAQYYKTSTDLTVYQPAFSVAPWTFTQSADTYKTLTVLPTVYKGKVVNSKTGKALKGVKVTVAGNSNYAFKTNSSGMYTTYKVTTDKQTICLLKPNTKYKVKFSKKGYKSKTRTLMSFPADFDPAVPDPDPITWVDVSNTKLVKK
jgi:hypothetical protein